MQFLQLGHCSFFVVGAGYVEFGNRDLADFPVLIAGISQSAGWAATTQSLIILHEIYR